MTRMLRLLTIATALMAAGCSRDPGRSTQQHIDAGDHYAQAGQYKEASIEYRNAIKTTPTSVEAHARLESRDDRKIPSAFPLTRAHNRQRRPDVRLHVRKRKPQGMMPTTVYGLPFTMIFFPRMRLSAP